MLDFNTIDINTHFYLDHSIILFFMLILQNTIFVVFCFFIYVGQKTNTLDSNFGELFHEFVTSKEKTNISAGQFLSTFYNSLTRESTVVLLTLPLILLMMTLLATLVSLPTLVTFLATSYSRADNIDDIHTKDYDEVLSYIDNQESTYNDPRYYQY